MKKENALITQESTEVVLRKATNIMSRTNKILKNSKKALATHPDVMMINGLMWQKETVEEEMNWDDAMEYAKNLRLGGYDDWRLPTIDELIGIVTSCGGININLLNDDSQVIIDKNLSNKFYQEDYKSKGFSFNFYWSSTADARNNNCFNSVYFGNGNTSNSYKSCSFYIRCVREAK